MLTNITIENFKSYKEKTKVDFRATGYEILNKTNKNEDNILKGALFVGGNATGKSNIIKALKFLLSLLVWEVKLNSMDYLCLFSKGNMKLEYEFEFKKQIIKYSISCDKNGSILAGSLELNNKEIITRIKDNAKYSNDDYEILLDNLNDSNSVVRKIYFENKFNNNETLLLWFKFLENSVFIDQSKHLIQTFNVLNNNYRNYFEKNGDEKFNNFLKEINYGQEVIFVSEYKSKAVNLKFSDDLGNPKKELVFKRNDMDFALPINLESEGNRTLANVFSYIIEACEKPCMILIDEFSSGFHNFLEETVIKYFMKHSINSQLFLVSHSTNLLNNNILRPDQIYTVDFITGFGSKVNRVSDEKPREAQNIEKMYLNGVFNGIPNYK